MENVKTKQEFANLNQPQQEVEFYNLFRNFVGTLEDIVTPPAGPTLGDKGLEKTIYASLREDELPGSGTADDPYNVNTSTKFDDLLWDIRQNEGVILLYLPSGTYLTKGRNIDERTAGWNVGANTRIVGLGDVTIKLEEWPQASGVPWIYKHSVISCDESGSAFDNISIENVTIDANWPNLTGKPRGYLSIFSNNTNVSDNDTIQIGNKIYRFKTTPSTEGDVDIGANADGSLTNLIRAINHTGTPGTDYICANAHTQVAATATLSGHSMEVYDLEESYDGAEYILVTTTAATLTVRTNGAETDAWRKSRYLQPKTALIGLYLVGSHNSAINVRIKNCYGDWNSLQECFGMALGSPSFSTYADDILIDGCKAELFHGDYGVGINAWPFWPGKGIVKNCLVEITEGTPFYGIGVIGRGCSIIDNTIKNAFIGVYQEQTSGTLWNRTEELLIADNRFMDIVYYGILVQANAGSTIWKNWKIDRNFFSFSGRVQPGGAGMSIGAELNGGVPTLQNVEVTRNKFFDAYNSSPGTRTAVTAALSTGLHVEDNYIQANMISAVNPNYGGTPYLNVKMVIRNNRDELGNTAAGLFDYTDSYNGIKTAEYACLNQNEVVLTNTAGGAFTVLLPVVGKEYAIGRGGFSDVTYGVGSIVEVVDYGNNWGTNNLTVATYGENPGNGTYTRLDGTGSDGVSRGSVVLSSGGKARFLFTGIQAIGWTKLP